MSQVCGYAAQHAKAPLTPYYFERRKPRDNDVAIDIQYSGICHSDIHQIRNEWGGSTFPMVPGHEIAGIVSEVGTRVSRYGSSRKESLRNIIDGHLVGNSCKIMTSASCFKHKGTKASYFVEAFTFIPHMERVSFTYS
jgi:alcohol dehydrogenase (NADP+)